ncbi:class I SAM-dependent methyltransferase [Nocardioides sp. GXQ0305]|uniref:class I SAM-dependent methyltransferase n=1 Tax=Nocardioides sp. GXQ0305 TaxID=3423912 RepID=UPI003D7DF22B
MTQDWQQRADELAAESIGAGRPTAWFDRLYAAGVAGEVGMPWSRDGAHPALEEWANGLDGAGRRAVVVGSGLGADAAHLARLGFATTGFDVAPTAVDEARRRHGGSGADFVVADLLALPAEWREAFDLVVEVFTLQALPDPPRSEAAAAVTDLVAPGGTLLAVQFRADGTVAPDDGPPFPLDRAFMTGLAHGGLDLVRLEELEGPLWRAEYRRLPAHSVDDPA